MKPARAFLFDLDGTLIDSVYQHVLAWREALEEVGMALPAWIIHRRIGMSGGLIAAALQRETGRPVSKSVGARIQTLHTEYYLKHVSEIRPLPGAKELLKLLTKIDVPWTIATSSSLERAQHALKLLKVSSKIPVVTRDDVAHGKPDPDLFLMAAKRLGVDIHHDIVVGDSVWDLLAARRAGALGVGVLSGGYGEDELVKAGAYRVYQDPADLLRHLDELGVRMPESEHRKGESQ
jgi:HAD superfamily hydrolase (TIGR01509 family)